MNTNTIEEHVRRLVAASSGDQETLVHDLVREIESLHAAMPSAADLEAVAYHFETACGQEVESPDGTTFDASVFLRRAARLVRETEREEHQLSDNTAAAAHG
jgi:hypothetical protein